MARSSRSRARRRALAVVTATATAAGAAALLAPGTGTASSHREAPYILNDPAVDNTDTYAFVSPDASGSVTLIANWFPNSDPAGGPNFFPWDTTAAYDINIDNDGDARADLTYRWTFNDVDRRGTRERGAVDGSILYNDGPVTSLTDDNLLFRQTYDLTLLAEGAAAPVSILNDAPVAPSNVGKASIPNYPALRNAAIRPVGTGAAASKSFVGQADDPFFLDLRVFDLLYGGDFSEVGYDTLSGYNVNTIAYQVPKAALANAGNATANPVVGVWSTTSRRQNRDFAANNADPGTSATDSSDATADTGSLVQVSRLGNPLVNELVPPANLKDFFNRSTPDTDAKFLPKVQNPEVPVLIEQVYGIPNPNRTPGGRNRPDLAAVFLTGISKNQSAGNGVGGISKGSPDVDLNSLDLNRDVQSSTGDVAPAEYLRLNMGVAPTARPNRLGVIAGDNAGYPNGRRLADDVVDITLQAAEGVLVPDQPAATKAAVRGLGDGVSVNDRPFLSTFPYVSDANSGSDPRRGQEPVQLKQRFTSRGGVITAQAFQISPAAPGGTAQLFQVNRDGSSTSLGFQPLNAAGTATRATTLRAPVASNRTLYYRVIPKRGSAAGTNRGVPTTFTVR